MTPVALFSHPILPTPGFPLPHKVPMCLCPPLVCIGPIGSIRERICSGNQCIEWTGPKAEWSPRGPATLILPFRDPGVGSFGLLSETQAWGHSKLVDLGSPDNRIQFPSFPPQVWSKLSFARCPLALRDRWLWAPLSPRPVQSPLGWPAGLSASYPLVEGSHQYWSSFL